MPLYEFTLEQTLGNQQMINRFNYQSNAVPGGALGALQLMIAMGAIAPEGGEAFGEDTTLGKLRPLQSTDTLYVQCIARNLYSVTDFYTYAFPPNTFGENGGGQSLSPTQAVGLTSDRTRSDIRRAQKRFGGVTEADVNAAGVLTSGAQTTWQQLGDTMGDIAASGVGGDAMLFTPYTFGREKYVVTESGKDAYKYYDTEAEQLDHIARINVFNVKTTVRTQTSRQYGRGS